MRIIFLKTLYNKGCYISMDKIKKPYQEKQIISKMDFPVDVFTNKNNPMNVGLHWHDSIEILFVLKGKTKLLVNDKSFQINQNDFIIINENIIHGTEACPNFNAEIIVIQFLPQLIEQNLVNLFESKYIIPFLKYNPQGYVYDNLTADQEIYNIILRIYQEFSKRENAYELYIKGSILQIITCLIRNSLLEIDNQKLEDKLKRLKPILNYIDINFQKDIDLKKASQMVNLSYYHFSRHFKKVIGQSFTEYLNFIRVLEAKKLLLTSDLNISEIAYQVGYSNVSSFNRAFKKINGITPGEFERANFVKD